jgi:cytochrome c2
LVRADGLSGRAVYERSKFAPGTRMNYPGLTDAAKQQALVEYLKTLK